MTATSMSWLRSVLSARRGICIASKAVRTATALGKFRSVFWFLAYFAEIVPQSRVFADYTQLLGPALLHCSSLQSVLHPGMARALEGRTAYFMPFSSLIIDTSSGLSLRAGGRGFSPATMSMAPGYFYRKTEEK